MSVTKLPIYSDYGKNILMHIMLRKHIEAFKELFNSHRRYSRKYTKRAKFILGSILLHKGATNKEFLRSSDGTVLYDDKYKYATSEEGLEALEMLNARHIKGLAYSTLEWLKNASIRKGGRLSKDEFDKAVDFQSFGVVESIANSIPGICHTTVREAVAGSYTLATKEDAEKLTDSPSVASFKLAEVYIICDILLGRSLSSIVKKYGEELVNKVLGKPLNAFDSSKNETFLQEFENMMTKVQADKNAAVVETNKQITELRNECEVKKQEIQDQFVIDAKKLCEAFGKNFDEVYSKFRAGMN